MSNDMQWFSSCRRVYLWTQILLNKWRYMSTREKKKIGYTAALSSGFTVVVISAIFRMVLYPCHPNINDCDIQRTTNPKLLTTNYRKLGIYNNAAVAADVGLCSEIGRDILRKNGSAVDAILAITICQGATNSESTGIGGGFFMTYYDRETKRCTAINAREMAGIAATRDMFSAGAGHLSVEGMLSVAVPGELHGMWTAHKRFGILPWEELFKPTIKLCRRGFPVTGHFAEAILAKLVYRNIRPETGMDFLINPVTKNHYKESDIMRRPIYAAMLQNLSKSRDPVKMFYDGYIARSLVSDIQAEGGILTLADFRRYRTRVHGWRDVVTMPLGNGLTLCGPPPPSSAAVVAAILGIIEKFNFTAASYKDNPVLTYHRFIESFKYGYSIRDKLADRRFEKGVRKIIKRSLSNKWLTDTWQKITDRARKNRSDYAENAEFVKEDHGTSQMCAVDIYGNAASLTATINARFGAKRRSKSTGIILNNQMDDFAIPGRTNYYQLPPAAKNFIKPGKRPQSSKSPIIIFNTKDGMPRLVIGGAGGSRIITGVAYATALILWLNHNVKDALDAARVHDQLYPNVTYYEEGLSLKIVRELELTHGHKMESKPATGFTSVVAIERKDGRWYCNSDYRKQGGYPAGF